MKYTEICMPRLGINDNEIFLGKWTVKNGSKVEAGQKLAVIESTKQTGEIISPENGYIYQIRNEGEDVKVGDVVAKICDEQEEGFSVDVEEVQKPELKLTKKAKELLDLHPEIDTSLLSTTEIIKEKDIEKLISKPFSIESTLENSIIIYGTGGLCKDIIDIVNQNRMYKIAGIIDFNYPESKELYGIPVLGGPGDLDKIREQGYNKMISAVAFWGDLLDKHYRKNPYSRMRRSGFELVNVIDRNASIAATVSMGVGNLICANAYIGPDVQLGNNAVINVGATINHDCIISDHCHVASGAILAGSVIIGENSLIGQGVVVHANVKIGKNVTINNGCIIFKDVPDGKIVEK